MKKYGYFEEYTLVLCKQDWERFYSRYVDKNEYPTFDCWWYDMSKMHLIEEV